MQNKLRRSLCAVGRGGASIALILAISAAAGAALAEEKEPVAILELGGAGSWDVRGGASFGPSAAVEFEPIKNNLVMEAGLTPFFDNHGHADWNFDLLFRHLFKQLSPSSQAGVPAKQPIIAKRNLRRLRTGTLSRPAHEQV